MLGPRLVIAGTHSGAGKTTIATGIMAALSRSGLKVASAKVGPDYIDPGYHSLATGRPGRNIDTWMCGSDSPSVLAAHAARGSDLLVVEGVMGLFDGVGSGHEASTAEVALALQAPVVLVVDASSMSASVAAIVHGYATLRPEVRVAGVILNRVGSTNHESLLREALAGGRIPVLGAVHRDDALVWRDRHLGLVPVTEDRLRLERSVERLAGAVAARVDLGALVTLARSAPLVNPGTRHDALPSATARIAIAAGRAFSFTYPDNLERLEEAGAQLCPFDPLDDADLPDGAEGLYAGGGFPEVYAEALASNRELLGAVGRRVAAGMVTWAECGGLLWLARSLDGHQMCGAIPADARMGTDLHLGYRTATALVANPVTRAGSVLRGHEFHYSSLDPAGDAMRIEHRRGGSAQTALAGHASPTMMASYLHVHLGTDPAPAERFVAAVAATAGSAGR